MMVDSSMTDSAKVSPGAGQSYAGWIGKLSNSPIYAATIGLVANSRMARLVLLLAIPLVWIVTLHIGPIYQMARISVMDNYPPAPGGTVWGTAPVRQLTIGRPWASASSKTIPYPS